MKRRTCLTMPIILIFKGSTAMNIEPPSDLLEYASETDFPTTMNRLVAAIEEAGMSVFARIDHAAAAQDAGFAMPPTVVLFFGNPKGGTPLMLASPKAALDLPLRVLLREGSDGMAVLSFRPIAQVLRAAGVPEDMAARLQPSQQVVLKAIRP